MFDSFSFLEYVSIEYSNKRLKLKHSQNLSINKKMRSPKLELQALEVSGVAFTVSDSQIGSPNLISTVKYV